MYDGIVEQPNGTYTVYIKYQDGTDSRPGFKTIREAIQAWVAGHRSWNGVDRDPNEAKVFWLKDAQHEVAPLQRLSVAKIMLLDPKSSHRGRENCQSRLAQNPRGDWFCVDCQVQILWRGARVLIEEVE